ncbi:MAG: hypothetical protein LV481_02575 [Methylacidiphilales bacterium]|nr:hypothetical protein [Candidatus Methylacidiphilales bacterium]
MIRFISRLRLILLVLPVVLFQTGCASSNDTSPSGGNVDASGQPVSSVPWNKPESWESNGQLGAMQGQ